MNHVHAQQQKLKESIEGEAGTPPLAWLIGCERDFGEMLASAIQHQGRNYRDVEMACLMGPRYISKVVAAYRPQNRGKRFTRKLFAMTENVFFLLEELGFSIVVARKDRALALVDETGTPRGPAPKFRARKERQLELPWGPLPQRKRSRAWAEAIVEDARVRAQLKAAA